MKNACPGEIAVRGADDRQGLKAAEWAPIQPGDTVVVVMVTRSPAFVHVEIEGAADVLTIAPTYSSSASRDVVTVVVEGGYCGARRSSLP